MPNIFVNQTGLALYVETGINLSLATAHKIIYQKPTGAKGSFVSTVSGTQLVYNVQPGDFDTPGLWNLQAFVTIAGLDSYGQIAQQNVINNLN